MKILRQDPNSKLSGETLCCPTCLDLHKDFVQVDKFVDGMPCKCITNIISQLVTSHGLSSQGISLNIMGA